MGHKAGVGLRSGASARPKCTAGCLLLRGGLPCCCLSVAWPPQAWGGGKTPTGVLTC